MVGYFWSRLDSGGSTTFSMRAFFKKRDSNGLCGQWQLVLRVLSKKMFQNKSPKLFAPFFKVEVEGGWRLSLRVKWERNPGFNYILESFVFLCFISTSTWPYPTFNSLPWSGTMHRPTIGSCAAGHPNGWSASNDPSGRSIGEFRRPITMPFWHES